MRLSVADRSSWATRSLFPYSFLTPTCDVAIIFSPMSQKDMPVMPGKPLCFPSNGQLRISPPAALTDTGENRECNRLHVVGA